MEGSGAAAAPKKRRWGEDTASSTSAASADAFGTSGSSSASPPATKPKLSSESIAEALAKVKAQTLVQKQLQEKIAQMGYSSSPPPGSAPSSPPPPQHALSVEGQVAAAKAAMVAQAMRQAGSVLPNSAALLHQQMLQAQTTPPQRMAPTWKPLILDSQGRQVDVQGNVVDYKRDVNSLMVNKPKVEVPAEPLPPPPEPKPTHLFIDPRFGRKAGRDRQAKSTFNFAAPGKYIKKAQNFRQKQLTEEMKKQAGDQEEEIIIRSVLGEGLPNVEWWDLPLVGGGDTYTVPAFSLACITSYIHVPAALDPPAEKALPPPQPLMLTQEERRKIRRMRKLEREKEKQDLIRVGLMPTPEAKVKMSNIMRVLGDQAVADPSSVEATVRRQIAARQQKHDQHNRDRALSSDQKKEKRARKNREDTSVEVHIAVFRCGDLEDAQRLFKVVKNAEQYFLTGRAIIQKECNVVVVEGGPKGIKKYTRLMLHRIQWGGDDDGGGDAGGDEGDDSEGEDADAAVGFKPGQKCTLVWKGTSDKRAFKDFLKLAAFTEGAARKHLAEKNVAHYWDLCKKAHA